VRPLQEHRNPLAKRREETVRVAIIGSRICRGFRPERIAEQLPEDCTQIVSGGAVGIDIFAKLTAERLGIPFLCFFPDYERYGKRAPIIRNKKIVDAADIVLAFWDYRSKGTANAIAWCIEKGIPVRIFDLNG